MKPILWMGLGAGLALLAMAAVKREPACEMPSTVLAAGWWYVPDDWRGPETAILRHAKLIGYRERFRRNELMCANGPTLPTNTKSCFIGD